MLERGVAGLAQGPMYQLDGNCPFAHDHVWHGKGAQTTEAKMRLWLCFAVGLGNCLHWHEKWLCTMYYVYTPRYTLGLGNCPNRKGGGPCIIGLGNCPCWHRLGNYQCIRSGAGTPRRKWPQPHSLIRNTMPQVSGNGFPDHHETTRGGGEGEEGGKQ